MARELNFIVHCFFIYKLFLYTEGSEGNPSKTLRDMLKYIETSVNDSKQNLMCRVTGIAKYYLFYIINNNIFKQFFRRILCQPLVYV